MVKDFVYDVFEISEKTIDRVSRRRSIEATAEPDNCVVQFSCNRTDPVDVLVVAPMETLLTDQTTANNKIITPSWDLLSPQPVGGRYVSAVRSLSGDSSRSCWPRSATEGRPAALRYRAYAVTPGGSYTSPRSSM